MVQLFVSDWEGCVTEAEGGAPWNLTELLALADTVRRLRETRGAPPFVLCTGRQFPYGEAALQAIGAVWDGMPSILENGAGLYYPATRRICWNPAITRERLDGLREVRQQISRVLNDRGGAQLPGKEICISIAPPDGKTVEWLCATLTAELTPFIRANVIETPTHSRSAVDITPHGVNKGSGVRMLAEITEIPLAAIVGIGDSRGDLPLLREVGYPCAPANAEPLVKEAASYVSPDRTTRGVIDIVHRHVPEIFREDRRRTPAE